MGAADGGAERSVLDVPARMLARESVIVVAAHAAACVLVLALGFDHVSDDDYTRVTIAQAFAHAPRLDPSGTSWLPFPFWALGTAMIVFGRSLATARVASIALASLALALPYAALRMSGSTRTRAMLAIAFATLSPWSLWLGAATVPESFTASFTAAAAFALGTRPSSDAGAARVPPSARVGFAVGLLAACLSRYEAWPVAAVLAIVLATQARRDPRVLPLVALTCAGPLLWLAWNAHAHGDALHFLARVTRFKRDLGEGTVDWPSALLLYPRLLVTSRPDVVLAALCAVLGARLLGSATEARARWLVPLACAGAQVAFLAYGNATDGAAAHHVERALLGTIFIVSAFAADVVASAWPAARTRARGLALGSAAILALAWLATSVATFRELPGASAAEDRAPQIAAGDELRRTGAQHLVLTPCAFEQFALIAAYRAPELVETRPRTGAPVVATCPLVERR